MRDERGKREMEKYDIHTYVMHKEKEKQNNNTESKAKSEMSATQKEK
jgi:hypothetical protein